MTLTLIPETGVGLPDANSYVTVDEADAYMERIPDSYRSAWLAADATQKTQVLVWATQLFDDYVYFPSSNSIRLSIAQALHFPRAGFVDYDGYVIPEHTVPTFVKHATIQMASELLKTDRTSEPRRGILAASVGPLSVTFDGNPAHFARVFPRSVRAIIAPFGGAVRGDAGVKSVPLHRA